MNMYKFLENAASLYPNNLFLVRENVTFTGFIELIKARAASLNKAGIKAGDVVEAKVSTVDKKKGKLTLSIKALEIEEEKKALEEYSNTTSGSTLGDALGEALKKK